MIFKKKLSFKVNGVKQTLRLSLISKGHLLDNGKWKSKNLLSKYTFYTTLDENGNVINTQTFDSHGNEVIEKGDSDKSTVDIEKKYDDSGKVIYERNTKSGNEVFHEYDENGFEFHRILPLGYEHFYIPDDLGNISGIRIEKEGKEISNSIEYWSDDKCFKIRKTENIESGQIQYFIHKYIYKNGKPIKVLFYK